MKKVEFRLPDDVYYQYQQMAGEARQDTDVYIRQVLLEKVDYDGNETDSGGELRQLILDWDWPQNQPELGSTLLTNVEGVIKYMDNGYEFSEATKRQAEDVKEERDVKDYNQTARADCTQKDRGVAYGVDKFKEEVESLLESYHS